MSKGRNKALLTPSFPSSKRALPVLRGDPCDSKSGSGSCSGLNRAVNGCGPDSVTRTAQGFNPGLSFTPGHGLDLLLVLVLALCLVHIWRLLLTLVLILVLELGLPLAQGLSLVLMLVLVLTFTLLQDVDGLSQVQDKALTDGAPEAADHCGEEEWKLSQGQSKSC